MSTMNNLFGTSGVRGIANEKITPELALNLAKSLSAVLDDPREVLIGRDTRLSSKMIEDALVAGFLSAGLNVKKIGIAPTPVIGFSVSKTEVDAGVMITASHNPPEYNGIKFFDSRGMALTPEKERKIEKLYYSRDFRTPSWSEIRNAKKLQALKNYLEKVSGKVSLKREHTVAIDCANGPSSKTTPQLLENLDCKVLTINSQLDGRFPGRPPEPAGKNLQNLRDFVKSSKANIGFAHDGDGDRIAVVDDRGRMVEEDKLLALIGSYSVERFGKGIVTTVDSSKIVEEYVRDSGGKVVRTKVGDVSVAQEMYSRKIKFGGEPSGTWIIGDIHMCPDGTLAAARILEMLESRKEKLSELVDSMPSYPILREKFECPNDEKEGKMKLIEKEAPSAFEEIENILKIDGIRLKFENGDWILIRPSGTEPYIRVTAEANEKSKAKSLVKIAKEILT